MIDDVLTLAGRWFRNFQKDNGLFHYQYDVRTGEYSTHDNIVRQIGCALAPQALGMDDVVDRLCGAIESIVERQTYDGRSIRIIPFDGLYKINAIALYTILLLNDGKNDDVDEFVIGMELMEVDDSFLYLYYVPKQYNKISGYATGEVLYALAKHMRATGDDRNSETMQRVFNRMYETCIDQDFTDAYLLKPFFAWGLYYLSEMMEMGHDGRRYIESLVDRFLTFREQYPIRGVGEATFLEGVARVYPWLVDKRRALRYIDDAVEYIMDRQVQHGEAVGGFVIGRDKLIVRNDLCQHATLALLNVRNHVQEYNHATTTASIGDASVVVGSDGP